MAWPDDDPLIEEIENRDLYEEEESNRFGIVVIVISVLVILAMLLTLAAPILRSYRFSRPTPTPTFFLREARLLVPEGPPLPAAVPINLGFDEGQAQNHRGAVPRLGM